MRCHRHAASDIPGSRFADARSWWSRLSMEDNMWQPFEMSVAGQHIHTKFPRRGVDKSVRRWQAPVEA